MAESTEEGTAPNIDLTEFIYVKNTPFPWLETANLESDSIFR